MVKLHRGLSLVELLMGVGLLALMAVTVTTLLFTTLRSARKAAAIAAVKNEGAYVLNSMSTMIKYADSISCPSSTSLTVNRLNNPVINYTFASGKIASTSGDLTSDNVLVTGCTAGAVFTCAGNNSYVNICFNVQNKVGSAGFTATDVYETAGGANGINFQSQVVLRNFVN